MYFIANWKMFGDLRTLNSLDSVIKFSKNNQNTKFRIIYCPPNILIRPLSKRLKKQILKLEHKIVMKVKTMEHLRAM